MLAEHSYKQMEQVHYLGTAGTVQPAQGADTQVIFNDGGAYAGNTGFTFNKTTGNLDIPGNIIGASKVSGTTIGGSLVTNAQPNITSVGTLTSLILGGTLNTNSDIITNAGNIEISAGTGTFKGDGAGLSSLTGANVLGEVTSNSPRQQTQLLVLMSQVK